MVKRSTTPGIDASGQRPALAGDLEVEREVSRAAIAPVAPPVTVEVVQDRGRRRRLSVDGEFHWHRKLRFDGPARVRHDQEKARRGHAQLAVRIFGYEHQLGGTTTSGLDDTGAAGPPPVADKDTVCQCVVALNICG